MGAEQNIDTVKAMYEAFGRGDVDAVLERCTDDLDWSTDAAIEVAPWYGPKHGKVEVASFFAGIAETGPVTEFTRDGKVAYVRSAEDTALVASALA